MTNLSALYNAPSEKLIHSEILEKATKEQHWFSNLLSRQFKEDIPGETLLTDITYFFYDTASYENISIPIWMNHRMKYRHITSDRIMLDIPEV